MEPEGNNARPGLHRSASHKSNTSSRSQSRSQTVRAKPARKNASYASSASSIAHSDKSLTSFPSFSPEPAKVLRSDVSSIDASAFHSPMKALNPCPSIVESLTTSSPSVRARGALFDDAPVSTQNIPGAIHNASDEHIERLLARHGGVKFVRQIAEDLATRDAQISTLRRKAEERERALRRIILECGLSNMDLEARLRAIESESKPDAVPGKKIKATPTWRLEDLMNDAMSDTVEPSDTESERAGRGDATIRASDMLKNIEGFQQSRGTSRGWKDYLFGTGRGRSTSRAPSATGRRPLLKDDVFAPPDSPQKPSSASVRSSSRASSTQSGLTKRSSTSFASLALKLVAGNATISRENGSGLYDRGRTPTSAYAPSTLSRGSSTASARLYAYANGKEGKSPPKTITANGRKSAPIPVVPARALQQERWDTMGSTPAGNPSSNKDNFGPVEMDAILPLETQPPTVVQNYNSSHSEFLTDRFGFIYDQRRKKRQREAAEMVKKTKRGSRVEMLSGYRSNNPPDGLGDDEGDSGSLNSRPDTPLSSDVPGEDGRSSKRWQDYLKITTLTTELLSHTPASGVPNFSVMEGGGVTIPKSPTITNDGFMPSATSATTAPVVSGATDYATISKPTDSQPQEAPLAKEEVEPVRLLLEQLSEVHDSLQRDKTVKWNEFLRKVRAERRREGEAAAAAKDPKSQGTMAIMPEATLTDGEIIGVAGLGVKGKVGRAKWNEFKLLVLSGIPVAYRAKVWAECSGAAGMRIPGYYEDLVSRSPKKDDPAIVSQINADINRTLTDNIFFRRGAGVAKLNEVLLAYSRRNAEVGYCQGMNMIAACLLLIMPTAEDAFWVLTSMIETILPQGYFDHSLLASRADSLVLRQYVREILPRLSSYLDDLCIELETLSFQWFLSVFTDCLSAEALFRVWDVVFCTNDGSTFLFQVALALLKLNEQQLLACDSSSAAYTYLNRQMTNHAISIDGLIHASEGLRKVVKRDEVETRRAKVIESEKVMLRQREEQRMARKIAAASAAASQVNSEINTPLEVVGSEAGILGGNANAKKESLATTPPTLLDGKTVQQSRQSDDVFGELLTARTPMPVDEERALGLG